MLSYNVTLYGNIDVAKGWIVYLMLLGSSRPYPWFILEENGR